MTLPFENDTSRIVKKYAKHSISQSRVKTFLSVLTIALAVALLSGFALSVIGMETEAKRELLVSSQMLYHNLNDEQMQTLRHDERISDSKIYMQAANTQIENYLVIPVYIEQNNSQIVMDEIVEGQYPIDLYDVAVDKAYLEQLGLPAELGATITIPFYDGNKENFKQVTTTSAVKQDLVISCYKPKDSFRREFLSHAGSEDTAWAFVRQHLANIPVVVVKNDRIEVVAERQAYLLFDRMVAYHIMQGIPVPLDATDFYRGLDEKFLKRDNMYFLPDQVNEYDTARITTEVENIQFELFVTNEKSAISWLYQQLDEQFCGPQTYAELQPKFMQEVKAVDKYEQMPELATILEENFLQDGKGRWYIPDVTKEGDLVKLREKNLWKEFEGYMNSKGKLKLFRSEAIRVGFSRLWKEKNYKAIVDIAERLPEQTIQEDSNLLMYYDISLGRV